VEARTAISRSSKAPVRLCPNSALSASAVWVVRRANSMASRSLELKVLTSSRGVIPYRAVSSCVVSSVSQPSEFIPTQKGQLAVNETVIRTILSIRSSMRRS
jgi:hypothetical protein